MLAGQGLVDYIGENFQVEYEVISNVSSVRKATITFSNKGDQVIPNDGWAIYLYDLSRIASESLAFDIDHIVGGLYKVLPTEDFRKLHPDEKIELPLTADYSTASRFYVYPNWYVAQPGFEPRVLKSTADEFLSFVKDFDTPEKWKKTKLDKWNPFSPEERYKRYKIKDLAKPGQAVIPTPLSCELSEDTLIDLSKEKWSIKYEEDIFKNEAEILKKRFAIDFCESVEPQKATHLITLRLGEVENPYSSNEAYKIELDHEEAKINITASTSAGMFYAIQTLFSMLEDPRNKNGQMFLPSGVITDAPRFPYRGFHIDVSRNFVGADEIIKLIKVISTYKMNKLHFHLTDDEGWRLEIKDLPELTEVGAKRDHELASKGLAVEPSLGSGPSHNTSASGFYTVEDYQDILRCARDHNVEVIPEIDMPGHCYAAIVAMTSRYKTFEKAGDMEAALEYMLTDIDEESSYNSVQKFTNNTINPCLEGSKKFVSKIISTLKSLHEPIQPLKIFHVGGDEVPLGAWDASEACLKCYKDNELDGTDPFFDPDEYANEKEIDSQKMTSALQEHFMRFVEDLCQKEKLALAVWNDGVRDPTARLTTNSSKMVHAWRISAKNERHNPNILANSGYQVVISSATHTYFDHPYEPDPEECGLHWCVRMMDTRSVFGMKPHNMYACQDDRFNQTEHEKLKNKSGIIGIQSHVWGELIRTNELLEYMLFPRVLAIAERAWHEASWEIDDTSSTSDEQTRDWTSFANTIGYRELQRLEKLDVHYRIPPPGLLVKGDQLLMGSVYPNLKYKLRRFGAKQWEDVTTLPLSVNEFVKGERYEFVTSSSDGARLSRIVTKKF